LQHVKKTVSNSSRAFDAYPCESSRADNYAKVYLMCADESVDTQISYARALYNIGSIAENLDFHEFILLVKVCTDGDFLHPYGSSIATRGLLAAEHREVISKCLESGRLISHSDAPMSDRTISKFCSQSFVIWNAYKRSIQSDILPKAYMYGAPVLVSISNASE